LRTALDATAAAAVAAVVEDPEDTVEHVEVEGVAEIVADAAAVGVDDVMGENRVVPVVPEVVAPAVEVVGIVEVVEVVGITNVVEGVEVVDVVEVVGVVGSGAGVAVINAVNAPDDVVAAVTLDELVVVEELGELDEDEVVVLGPAETDAGEHAEGEGVVAAAAAAGPETVPATALVVWVPLAVPPEVLMKMSLRMSGFCQYFEATSMTT
jgi:hypothetical protein